MSPPPQTVGGSSCGHIAMVNNPPRPSHQILRSLCLLPQLYSTPCSLPPYPYTTLVSFPPHPCKPLLSPSHPYTTPLIFSLPYPCKTLFPLLHAPAQSPSSSPYHTHAQPPYPLPATLLHYPLTLSLSHLQNSPFLSATPLHNPLAFPTTLLHKHLSFLFHSLAKSFLTTPLHGHLILSPPQPAKPP